MATWSPTHLPSTHSSIPREMEVLSVCVCVCVCVRERERERERERSGFAEWEVVFVGLKSNKRVYLAFHFF